MPLKDLLKEMAKLSPEERANLRDIFAPQEAETDQVDQTLLAEAKSELKTIYPHLSEAALQAMAIKQINTPKAKQPAKPAKAERVYFFQQADRFVTEDIEADKENPDILKKTGYYLPPRVIAVDKHGAWRLYWKQRNKFTFLGSSDGTNWRHAREQGMPVAEAYGVEFEAMKKNPDMTPPMNKEKTVFAGTKISQLQRGNEIEWGIGLKQSGSG